MASRAKLLSDPFERDYVAAQQERALNYSIVALSANEVREIQNAPSVSMGPYLVESHQTDLLGSISIYGQRGTNLEQIRLLYMNATALRIWIEMGRRPTLIGTQYRPPRAALLSFGVPFSE